MAIFVHILTQIGSKQPSIF